MDEESRGIKIMCNIKYSFIIPTLNEENTLDICLTSLMQQTMDNFEAIVVDGGSKDRTVDIAEHYGFNVLEVEKKRPHDVSSAKNEGVKYCNGDYVFFLDADMYVAPNCIEVLNKEFNDDNVIGVALKVLPREGTNLESFMYEVNNRLALVGNFIKFYQLSYFSCHCYDRDAFLKVGGFREDLLACEDLDLSLRISDLGEYRVTHDSILWTSPRRLREWSYKGYVLKYLKFLFDYYFRNRVNEYYDDMT
jgi:glycosyltransferase involved in cell wall biosynthesis